MQNLLFFSQIIHHIKMLRLEFKMFRFYKWVVATIKSIICSQMSEWTSCLKVRLHYDVELCFVSKMVLRSRPFWEEQKVDQISGLSLLNVWGSVLFVTCPSSNTDANSPQKITLDTLSFSLLFLFLSQIFTLSLLNTNCFLSDGSNFFYLGSV